MEQELRELLHEIRSDIVELKVAVGRLQTQAKLAGAFAGLVASGTVALVVSVLRGWLS